MLEIGFGTGLNLAHYPEGVAKLVTADPMDALAERVRERIERAPFPVEIHHLPADRTLPFDAGRFDCVTMTWTLCTIAEPVAARARDAPRPQARREAAVHRARPQRRRKVARWQDRWNPIQNVIGCGCNVNRKIDALVEQGGFRLAALERFLAEGAPRMFGEMYRGVAT